MKLTLVTYLRKEMIQRPQAVVVAGVASLQVVFKFICLFYQSLRCCMFT